MNLTRPDYVARGGALALLLLGLCIVITILSCL